MVTGPRTPPADAQLLAKRLRITTYVQYFSKADPLGKQLMGVWITP